MAGVEVRFGPLPRRTVLAGLTGAQLGLVATGLVVVIVAEYIAGAVGVAYAAPFWAGLLALGTVRVSGRTALAWLPLLGDWVLRRTTRRTTTVAAPRRPPVGTLAPLPGVPGRLRLAPSPSSPTVWVWDTHARTLTAVLPVTGSGFLLTSPDLQDVRVTGWARVLDGLCRQPAVARIQLLHRSVPDSASALRAWWARQLTAGSWPASVVSELLAGAEAGVMRTECLLALAVRADLGREGRRRNGIPDEDAIGAADRQLDALTEALTAADLQVGLPLNLTGLRRAIWTGYDPYAAVHTPPDSDDHPRPADMAVAADAAPAASSGVGVLGPMGVREAWDHVVTDTAHHSVYWIADWPRTPTGAGFLQPLLLAGQTRTVSVTITPQPTTRALREIRRAQVEQAADAGQRARIGRLDDAATRAQARELDRREADLVAGHGELAFTGLVTVTAPDQARLLSACAGVEAAAAAAACELRRLVGQQAVAHTAGALPVARDLT